jgi:carbonic anhydrase/acetyltransferase-like protein (isoleucine patch superfamily)
MVKAQLLFYTLVLILGPMLPIVGLHLVLPNHFIVQPLSILLVPLSYLVLFPVLCGAFSKLYASKVVPGKFPRVMSDPAYRARRMYGFFWSALYYNTPVLYFILQIEALKSFILRLFSYKGSTNVTIYPDSWIRDLPLLNFGDGVYISNKATLGTNLVLSTGEILVDRLQFGEKTIIGHLAIVGLGTKIGECSEIGIGVAIGLRCALGNQVRIAPTCAINHGVAIGSGTQIGAMSYIGTRAQIGENLEIPAGANIPAGAVIKTVEDLESIISSETSVLLGQRDELIHYLSNDNDAPAPKRKINVGGP